VIIDRGILVQIYMLMLLPNEAVIHMRHRALHAQQILCNCSFGLRCTLP